MWGLARIHTCTSYINVAGKKHPKLKKLSTAILLLTSYSVEIICTMWLCTPQKDHRCKDYMQYICSLHFNGPLVHWNSVLLLQECGQSSPPLERNHPHWRATCTFTKIDHHRAVLFREVIGQQYHDSTYVLDMKIWERSMCLNVNTILSFLLCIFWKIYQYIKVQSVA